MTDKDSSISTTKSSLKWIIPILGIWVAIIGSTAYLSIEAQQAYQNCTEIENDIIIRKYEYEKAEKFLRGLSGSHRNAEKRLTTTRQLQAMWTVKVWKLERQREVLASKISEMKSENDQSAHELQSLEDSLITVQNLLETTKNERTIQNGRWDSIIAAGDVEKWTESALTDSLTAVGARQQALRLAIAAQNNDLK